MPPLGVSHFRGYMKRTTSTVNPPLILETILYNISVSAVVNESTMEAYVNSICPKFVKGYYSSFFPVVKMAAFYRDLLDERP